MATQPGLFDVEERLQRLSDIGDQLEAYAAVVDFEIFRADLETALASSPSERARTQMCISAVLRSCRPRGSKTEPSHLQDRRADGSFVLRRC